MFFQAEDGIRDLVRSRGLGDVYKRQEETPAAGGLQPRQLGLQVGRVGLRDGLTAAMIGDADDQLIGCLLYTSDAADERSSVDLGGRRIIKKKKKTKLGSSTMI